MSSFETNNGGREGGREGSVGAISHAKLSLNGLIIRLASSRVDVFRNEIPFEIPSPSLPRGMILLTVSNQRIHRISSLASREDKRETGKGGDTIGEEGNNGRFRVPFSRLWIFAGFTPRFLATPVFDAF